VRVGHVRVRLSMLAAAGGFLALGLLIRAGGSGRVEQHSGTALYASMTYVGALFLRPRWSPPAAGGAALAWCWAVECFQVSGIPAELSARSLLSGLVLGIQFDPVDLLWYPAGIAPLVVVHSLLRRRSETRERESDRRR
jgi:hypothetical protein